MPQSSATPKQSESFLSEHGADVNFRDNDGLTLIHNACSKIILGVIPLFVRLLLLQYGADSNARDNNRRTPLHRMSSLSKYSYDHEVGVAPPDRNYPVSA